jgi:hypothetical protein
LNIRTESVALNEFTMGVYLITGVTGIPPGGVVVVVDVVAELDGVREDLAALLAHDGSAARVVHRADVHAQLQRGAEALAARRAQPVLMGGALRSVLQ